MDRSISTLRNICLGLIALACIVASDMPLAQPRDAGTTGPLRYDLSADEANAFERWMHSTCIGDEEHALGESLIRYRAALAAAFAKAVVDGPPEGEIARVRAAAHDRFAERAKTPLRQYRIEGVGKEDIARFERVSEDDYVDDQASRYALGYRANAVAGLGIVGGAAALELLERIAADKGNPLAGAAVEAIKQLRR